MKLSIYSLILLAALVITFDCSSQPYELDSTRISQIAKNFFEWYISTAKSHQTKEYNPIEIEDEDGMTTLDFTTYFGNLKALSFSDDLIKEEENSYSSCKLKLSKTKYSEYLKLTDLDQFESLDDDFTNYYRWTGGQEMFDFYEVTEVRIANRNATVIGTLYFDNSGLEKREFERRITMTMVKHNDKWEILNIKY